MKCKHYTALIIIALFLFFGCSQKKWVETTDDYDRVIEKYQINKEGLKDGPYEAYYEDGTLKENATYLAGKLEGRRVIYHPNGQKDIEEMYENNLLIGDYLNYSPQGQLILKATYKGGVMDGMLIRYDTLGRLIEEVTMRNNEENGPFREYYANGQLHWEGTYLNGDNEFGELKEYNEQGELLKKMECDSLAVCRTVWTKEDGVVVPKY